MQEKQNRFQEISKDLILSILYFFCSKERVTAQVPANEFRDILSNLPIMLNEKNGNPCKMDQR